VTERTVTEWLWLHVRMRAGFERPRCPTGAEHWQRMGGDSACELLRNRLEMGGIRYLRGLTELPTNRDQAELVQRARGCLEKFDATENTEFLLDLVNYALLLWRYHGSGFSPVDRSE